MGVLGWAAGQLVVTSLTLGYLKHKNVIQLNPTAIPNPSARSVLISTVEFGERGIVMLEDLWADIMKER